MLFHLRRIVSARGVPFIRIVFRAQSLDAARATLSFLILAQILARRGVIW